MGAKIVIDLTISVVLKGKDEVFACNAVGQSLEELYREKLVSLS